VSLVVVHPALEDREWDRTDFPDPQAPRVPEDRRHREPGKVGIGDLRVLPGASLATGDLEHRAEPGAEHERRDRLHPAALPNRVDDALDHVVTWRREWPHVHPPASACFSRTIASMGVGSTPRRVAR
jgi:hypothetical protein